MTSEQAQPGWYLDPTRAGQLRWWDGSRWSAASVPVAGADDECAVGAFERGVLRLVVVGAGTGMLVAALVAIVVLVRDEPLAGADLLIVPGVPLLIVEQFAIIMVSPSRPRLPRDRTSEISDRISSAQASRPRAVPPRAPGAHGVFDVRFAPLSSPLNVPKDPFRFDHLRWRPGWPTQSPWSAVFPGNRGQLRLGVDMPRRRTLAR